MFLAEIQFGPFAIEGDPKVFIAQMVGFLLLVVLLWKVNVPIFSRPYLTGVWREREVRVEDVHNQVESALGDTRRLHDEYANRLKNIEVEARERIEAAVKESDAAHTDIIADAQQASTLLTRRAEEELARERTRQRILLRRQIVQLSLDAAEGSVRDNNTDTLQRRLIGDFITSAAGSAVATAPAEIPVASPVENLVESSASADEEA